MVIRSPWPLNKDAKCHDKAKSATPSLEQGEHTHLQWEEVSVTPSWTCGWLNCKVLLPHLLLVLAGTSLLLLLPEFYAGHHLMHGTLQHPGLWTSIFRTCHGFCYQGVMVPRPGVACGPTRGWRGGTVDGGQYLEDNREVREREQR